MQKSGILLVDKPRGLSSAAVVAKIKRQFGFAKIGHGGTLDPFATGLLVILTEEATKIARFLLAGEKSYLAVAQLGVETDTGDDTGQFLEATRSTAALAPADFARCQSQFVGTILQKPPAFSALKQNGKRLYELARAGELVETEARPVTIHELAATSLENNRLHFFVRCEGGTYIRSLAVDWARAAGGTAHLAELRRTQTLGFALADAHTLDDILQMAPQSLPLLPLAEALTQLPKLHCDSDVAKKIANGNLQNFRPALPHGAAPVSGFYFLSCEDKPLAVLHFDSAQTSWKIERVFAV